MGKMIGYGVLGVAGLFLLTLAAGSWYTVEQGSRAVVLRWGELTSVRDPGLHWKVPIMDSVEDFEVRTQSLRFEGVQSYSKDIQQSESIVTVNYSLPAENVADVFTRFGTNYAERILQPAVLDRYKEVFGRYTAAELIANREVVGDAVQAAIAKDVERAGLIIYEVQVTNIDFTDEFERAVEAAATAKAEVSRADQVLLRKKVEAQTVVVEAEAQADANRAAAAGRADALRPEADAQAFQIEARGVAEAAAIEAKARALAANPDYVAYFSAQQWNGQLPGTMLPGSAVPFVTVP